MFILNVVFLYFGDDRYRCRVCFFEDRVLYWLFFFKRYGIFLVRFIVGYFSFFVGSEDVSENGKGSNCRRVGFGGNFFVVL